MGLDIKLYLGVKKLSEHEIQSVKEESGYSDEMDSSIEGCEFNDKDIVRFYLNNDYQKREDLGQNGFYTFEEMKYCWSGGYGLYNELRETLAMMAGYPVKKYKSPVISGYFFDSASYFAHENPHKKFYELIDFSDCEGFIGNKICNKLAKDFNSEYRYIREIASRENKVEFLTFYESLKDAFSEAESKNGFIQFT